MLNDRSTSDLMCFDPKGGLPRLLEIMARLRDPETGCPWDIEQTYASIARYTIEEAYEVADAIETGDFDELKSELGDLLLQVVYYTQMSREEGRFDFDDVANGIADKMVARHPHVFGTESRDKSATQQTRDWEKIKAAERAAKGADTGTLDGVALGLPALMRAVKLQKRAARVGFDWPDILPVLDKVTEELGELREVAGKDAEKAKEEFGDLLFVMANVARHLRIDPEHALKQANQKFTRRFSYIEARLAETGRRPEQSDLAEMDQLWDQAKGAENSPD